MKMGHDFCVQPLLAMNIFSLIMMVVGLRNQHIILFLEVKLLSLTIFPLAVAKKEEAINNTKEKEE